MEDQLCRVCEEKAAGFHFGAFTCEGCKSFFGRFCSNQTNIPDCKNNYECVIDKRNRTACKACRLRKCLAVGMSKSGCRYGRRSNWFKIHCLMQKKSAQNSLSTKMSQQSAQSSAGVLPRVSPTLSSASSFMNPRHPSSRSPSPLNTSSESSGPSPVPQASSPLIPFLPFLPSPHNNPFQSTPFQAMVHGRSKFLMVVLVAFLMVFQCFPILSDGNSFHGTCVTGPVVKTCSVGLALKGPGPKVFSS